MPGYLGTESQFNANFSSKIQAADTRKREPEGKSTSSSRRKAAAAEDVPVSSGQEQDAFEKELAIEKSGLLALEKLHLLVRPFILRRMKEDVLSELPDKIIQDIYLEPSDAQKALMPTLDDLEISFDRFNWEQKLCTDPSFYRQQVVSKRRDLLQQFPMIEWKQGFTTLDDSPKLKALKELLLTLGMGDQQQSGNESDTRDWDGRHRALIFTEYRETIDTAIERVLQNDEFKGKIKYLVIDGNDSPKQQDDKVKAFQQKDSNVDLLLLTKRAGGLGLNLTAADIVVMLEHDFNPANDLQAMDRAHRLGQKRVVQVYRFILRGTLEQQKVSTQATKLLMSEKIVGVDNSELSKMDAGRVLSLLGNAAQQAETERKKQVKRQLDEIDVVSAEGISLSKAARLRKNANQLANANPGDDGQQQYDSEFDSSNFAKSLDKK